MRNKGITMMTLVITIIVMIILAGVTITGAYSLIKKAQLENIKTNMLLIEAKTKTALEEYNFSKDETKLIGTKVEEGTEIASKLTNIGITSVDGWYYLNQQNFDDMKLSDVEIPENEYYLVKYDKENLDVEILYTAGYTENNTTKYTLTQMQNAE